MKTIGKVGRKRALQLLTVHDKYQISIAISYPPHFICKMVEEKKKKISS